MVHFGPIYARRLRARRPSPTGRWHLDEVFVAIAGRRMYLWRAIDDEGEVLDILVQARRDKDAALRLMRKPLKNRRLVPSSIVTDRYRAYDAALCDLGLSGVHIRGERLNTERKVRTFLSDDERARCKASDPPDRRNVSLSSHSVIYNTFNVCRHLTSANTHRILREQAFDAWS